VMETLPRKQREVLENIIGFIQSNGYPPTIQQLCDRCGVTSTSTIHYHLTTLKKKGFIHWNESERRAITVRDDLLKEKGHIPIWGTIAAGQPLTTVTDSVETLDLAEDVCSSDCYALRVRGDSMIEDHIMDGDMVLINPKASVRDGDVVVALVEGQTATLKRLYREQRNVIRLQPANSAMEPILVSADQVEVQGKLEAVIRYVT
jgi:repressor LexA